MNQELIPLSDQELINRLKEYGSIAKGAFAGNTLTALRQDLEKFAAWCLTNRSLRYNPDAVKNDDDTEILKKLKSSWGYDIASKSFKVIGKIKKIVPKERSPFYLFSDLRSAVNFEVIEYPIELNQSRSVMSLAFFSRQRLNIPRTSVINSGTIP